MKRVLFLLMITLMAGSAIAQPKARRQQQAQKQQQQQATTQNQGRDSTIPWSPLTSR